MHITSTGLLMFSPEFKLERELCTRLFYLLTLKLDHIILLFSGRLGRKLKEWIYVTYKETPCNKNKAEAYYLRVYASEYSYNG